MLSSYVDPSQIEQPLILFNAHLPEGLPAGIPEPYAPQKGSQSKQPLAKLVLGDGSVLLGQSVGADVSAAGEVVFYTGMTGYPETLTDPSYRGQILVFTYPLIGNYGVPSECELDSHGLPARFESSMIHVAGVVMTSYTDTYSHWNATSSLSNWLKKHNIPAIAGVDTRALTKKLRDNGALLGKVLVNNNDVPFYDPNGVNLIAQVSRSVPQVFGNGPKKIIAVDFGMKNNIIRYLAKPDVTLTVVPWNYDFTGDSYDGLFLSNGPGDPASVQEAIAHIRIALQRDTPIFGICMGHQVMALAAGAQTYKMKFGNRGMNQPVVDLHTGRCYVTSQNHGFAVDESSLPSGFVPWFRNANDNSNEGIIHKSKPFFSVQFHPEGGGGPTDTAFLFDKFLSLVVDKRVYIMEKAHSEIVQEPVRKVLLLGSGGLSIGQAGEFDYSGSQAIKALKEADVEVVLINPNVATVQTSTNMADVVYFLPITTEIVTDIIQRERPDGILLQFGGQTALNCGLELSDSGVLAKYNVRVFGTSVDSIRASEDRKIFAEKMAEINEKVAPSAATSSVEEALEIAERIGYPVLVRSAFALGGLGSGFAHNPEMLVAIVRQALSGSTQVIIDKSLSGWKEIEYEIVRDCEDNCIAVCNMENLDPLGIHTGDSVVVAPSQTLSNSEYFLLRNAALKIARHMEIVGECNVQYALDPNSENYYIIEMNARLSRSSALASKATGYPLAYVACKLALGNTLPQLKNSVTKDTTACFEPSLDYVVVKIPRWDLRKFSCVSTEIGSAMKSVGEIMAIGRTFEEAFQKGVRMVDGSLDGFGDTARDEAANVPDAILDGLLTNATDKRLLHVAIALRRGYSVDRLFQLTFIDKFFLYKLKAIMHLDISLSATSLKSLTTGAVLTLKQNGFADKQIARCLNCNESEVRSFRWDHGLLPFVKQIDTLSAEFPAMTNYLYTTYHASEHDVAFNSGGIVVLGCGSYRIGSSCEFDWCAVSCLRALKSLGVPSILINCNPETVSTDYDECDRLYFEELSLETVLDVSKLEATTGVIISVGGQIANNMCMSLHGNGVHVLGTHPESIDTAEDRFKFSALLDKIGVSQPAWKELTSEAAALKFAGDVGYPCLVRPSYVLSGAAMNVAHSPSDLVEYLTTACLHAPGASIVVTKFVENAQEIEFDAVARNGVVMNYAISEHVENAGVHSGDATLLLPSQTLAPDVVSSVKQAARAIATALKITGPFNIQFLHRDHQLMVIECNLRASRSFPFVSKTFNKNFIELATKAMLDVPVEPYHIDVAAMQHVCCKSPMFSFSRLAGADPQLQIEMASTGEVACFGVNRHDAFLKSLMATGFKLPKRNVFFSADNQDDRTEFLSSAQTLINLGYILFSTDETVAFLIENRVEVEKVDQPSSNGSHPTIIDMIKSRGVDLVINIPSSSKSDKTNGYRIRRASVDFSVSLITNVKLGIMLVESLEACKTNPITLHSWDVHVSADESRLH